AQSAPLPRSASTCSICLAVYAMVRRTQVRRDTYSATMRANAAGVTILVPQWSYPRARLCPAHRGDFSLYLLEGQVIRSALFRPFLERGQRLRGFVGSSDKGR